MNFYKGEYKSLGKTIFYCLVKGIYQKMCYTVTCDDNGNISGNGAHMYDPLTEKVPFGGFMVTGKQGVATLMFSEEEIKNCVEKPVELIQDLQSASPMKTIPSVSRMPVSRRLNFN